VEVGGRQEEVVGDDRERRGRRHASEESERQGDGGRRSQPEQPDINRFGQLRIPGGIGFIEAVLIGPPVPTVGEKGL
jgi:hypothetical protein